MRDTISEAGQGYIEKVIVAGLSNVYTHYITTYEVNKAKSTFESKLKWTI